MHLHFTTLFNQQYLSRGLTLYTSLKKVYSDFTLYIVALDSITYAFFEKEKLAGIVIIQVQEIETQYPELEILKKSKSSIDYIFTLSPYFPLYIFYKYPKIPHLCSLDADQYFFSDPSSIFKLLEDFSILITPHRFTSELLAEGAEQYGKYNVSFQVFKRDKTGIACLELWKEQCRTWCNDVVEDGKFADQKYLDSWEKHFGEKVKPINHKGLGLAPWNINNYNIVFKKGKIWVDDDPLILFHYQGLRILEHHFVYTSFDKYKAIATEVVRKRILKVIVSSLMNFQNNKKENISRNQKSFSLEEISKLSQSSYFKWLMGKMLTFEQYIKIKKLSSGLLVGFKNHFGKKG